MKIHQLESASRMMKAGGGEGYHYSDNLGGGCKEVRDGQLEEGEAERNEEKIWAYVVKSLCLSMMGRGRTDEKII